MTEAARRVSLLHAKWGELEDEHHELATAIDAARAGKANIAQMRERQAKLLLEINSLVAESRDAPATTIQDFLALLDIALEHELDLACDIAFYGPADYPITTRLLRAAMDMAPGFEFNSLRRWLSVRGQLQQLVEETILPAGDNHRPVEPIGFGDPEIPAIDHRG